MHLLLSLVVILSGEVNVPIVTLGGEVNAPIVTLGREVNAYCYLWW